MDLCFFTLHIIQMTRTLKLYVKTNMGINYGVINIVLSLLLI